MKRTKFIKYLNKYGCYIAKEGSNHSIIVNKKHGKKTTLPRHNEIRSGTIKSICKQLGINEPAEK